MLPLELADENRETLYKMIVLYMAGRVEFPLTRVQIAGFMEEKKYLGYLPLQRVFAGLSDAGLIREEHLDGRTQLSLTDAGSETLRLFRNEITPEIKKDIDDYLRSNAFLLRQESYVTTRYERSDDGYVARLSLSEGGSSLLDMSVPFPTEELAQSACRRFKENSQDLYRMVMNELLS